MVEMRHITKEINVKNIISLRYRYNINKYTKNVKSREKGQAKWTDIYEVWAFLSTNSWEPSGKGTCVISVKVIFNAEM